MNLQNLQVSLEPEETATLLLAQNQVRQRTGITRDLEELCADLLTLALRALREQMEQTGLF